MNIGNGLKAIVNVGCGLWMIIGAMFVIGGFNANANGNGIGQIQLGIILGLVAPIIIRYVIFYIINSFK
tara:strand:- start:47 stop:253 length:207 start_codon:yes stop_codon:yes gene_type:complete